MNKRVYKERKGCAIDLPPAALCGETWVIGGRPLLWGYYADPGRRRDRWAPMLIPRHVKGEKDGGETASAALLKSGALRTNGWRCWVRGECQEHLRIQFPPPTDGRLPGGQDRHVLFVCMCRAPSGTRAATLVFRKQRRWNLL